MTCSRFGRISSMKLNRETTVQAVMTIGANTTNPWKKKYKILAGLNAFITVFDTKIHPFQKSPPVKKRVFAGKTAPKQLVIKKCRSTFSQNFSNRNFLPV
jgi:hypothetical protein